MSDEHDDLEEELLGMLKDFDRTIDLPKELSCTFPLRSYMRDSGAPDRIGKKFGEYELTVNTPATENDSRSIFFIPNVYIPNMSLPVNDDYITYKSPDDKQDGDRSVGSGDAVGDLMTDYGFRESDDKFHYWQIDGIEYDYEPVSLKKFSMRCAQVLDVLKQKNFDLRKGQFIIDEPLSSTNPIFRVPKDAIALHVYNVVMYNLLSSQSRDKNSYVAKHIRAQEFQVDRNTIYGKSFINYLVGMNLVDPEDEKDKAARDISIRFPKNEHMLFLDCQYTPASGSSGLIRAVVHGVVYRKMNKTVLMRSIKLIEVAVECVEKYGMSKKKRDNWYLYFCGHTVRISSRALDRMVSVRLQQKGPHAPSLWVYDDLKLVVISVSDGCLMRPLTVYDNPHETEDQVYFDNHMMYNWRFVDKSTLSNVLSEPLNHCSVMFRHIPYFRSTEPPRHTIGINMSTQAIGRSSCTLTSSVRAVKTYPLISHTPYQAAMARLSAAKMSRPTNPKFERLSYPGVNLIVAYMLRDGTIEDSIIVSSRVNKKKLFHHDGFFRHPTEKAHENIEIMQKVTRSDDWYRLYDDGIVTHKSIGQQRGPYCTIYLDCPELRDGDKIATIHGQKGVVTLVDEEDIDWLVDTRRGYRFKPDVIMSIASTGNRGTSGQLYEGRFNMDVIQADIENFDYDKDYGINEIDETLNGRKALGEYECFVLDSDTNMPLSPIYKTSTDSENVYTGPPLILNYGVCRFFHLVHLARDKQHFVSSIPMSYLPRKGRTRGAGVKEGNMEVRAMMIKALTHCLQEDSYKTGHVKVNICPGCTSSVQMCCCEDPPEDYYFLSMNWQAYLNLCVYTLGQFASLKLARELTDDQISSEKSNSLISSIAGKKKVYIPRFT